MSDTQESKPKLWRGKNIDEMSREELISALKEVSDEYHKRNRMRDAYESEG